MARSYGLNGPGHGHFVGAAAGRPSRLTKARVGIDAIGDQILQLLNLLGGHENGVFHDSPMDRLGEAWRDSLRAFVSKVVLSRNSFEPIIRAESATEGVHKL